MSFKIKFMGSFIGLLLNPIFVALAIVSIGYDDTVSLVRGSKPFYLEVKS